MGFHPHLTPSQVFQRDNQELLAAAGRTPNNRGEIQRLLLDIDLLGLPVGLDKLAHPQPVRSHWQLQVRFPTMGPRSYFFWTLSDQEQEFFLLLRRQQQQQQRLACPCRLL